MFQHCPSLFNHAGEFDAILESWKEYKMTVPTYGAILLDPSLQFCLLVQGYWVKASWGFPKGKVNQDEAPVDCAIRENFEWFRVEHLPVHKKDTACKPLGLTPNCFFMVIPFVKNLRRWIAHKAGVAAAAAASDNVWAITQQAQQTEHQSAEKSAMRDARHQSASPRYQVSSSSRKPVQILKRDGAKAERKLALSSQDVSSSEGDKKSTREVYICPAWTNFRLDIDAVMNAMFPTTASVR